MNTKKRRRIVCAAAACVVTALCAVLAAASSGTCTKCGSYSITQTGGNDGETCTEPWIAQYRCDSCGETWTDSAGKPLGHKLGEQTVTKQATCTQPGRLERACTRSGCSYTESEETARTAHLPEHRNGAPARCEEAGIAEHFECTVCGALFLDADGASSVTARELVLPAAGHAWDTDATLSSCLEGGFSVRTCRVCGASGGRTDETEPAGHDMECTRGTPAACTDAGTKDTYTCRRCGGVFLDEKGSEQAGADNTSIPAAGHDLRRTAGAASTCTDSGTREHWTCTRCGHAFADAQGTQEVADTVLPAGGHRLAFVSGKDATCTTGGSLEHYACSECGDLFRDDQAEAAMRFAETLVPAMGHDLQHFPDKKAGEDADGWKEHWKCQRCGKLFAGADGTSEVRPEDVYLTATGHTLRCVEAVRATCTEDGTEEHFACTGCGAVFRDDKAEHPLTKEMLRIAASGHMEEAEVTEPSCLSSGFTRFTCTVCGSERTGVPTPAYGHDLVFSAEKSPTETAPGTRAHWNCLRCGRQFLAAGGKDPVSDPSDLVLSAEGHSYTDTVLPPSCTKPGYTQHVCSGCGHKYTDTEVAPKGHALVHVARVEPTETQDGRKEHWQCKECDLCFASEEADEEAKDLVLPAAGHSYTETVVPPRCTEPGYTEHVCSGCGDTYTDTDTEPAGHSLVTVPEVPPTEDEDGKREHWRCSVCGELFSDADGAQPVADLGELTIPAPGHDYAQTVVPADCENDGYTEHTCRDCGKTYRDEEAPRLGHMMTHFPAQAPTLTRDGNIAYWKCERCGRYFADENGMEEISAESVVRARLEKDPGGGAVATGDTADAFAYLAWAGIFAGTALIVFFLARRRRRG